LTCSDGSCATAKPGLASCKALVRTDAAAKPVTPAVTPSGYGPSSLQAAYNLPSSTAGAGRTVAIVDAFDDPTAESDLAVYRSQFGLPPCTTANGCFKKIDQDGGTNYPRKDGGWAGDSSAYQGRSGWLVFGGTSVSAPIIASVYALAGNTGSIDNNYPYAHSTSLWDVTAGSNGSCPTTQLCNARVGWDGPTDWVLPTASGPSRP
jgi:subtilase family serine protease